MHSPNNSFSLSKYNHTKLHKKFKLTTLVAFDLNIVIKLATFLNNNNNKGW